MKKIMFAAVSALALSALADGVSSTQFGAMTVVNSGAKRTLVAIPWDNTVAGGGDIAVSNLILTANLAAGDTLDALSTNGTSLCQWTLTKGDGDVLYWKEPTTVGEGDKVGTGTTANVATIKRGSAVVLIRKSGDLTKPFYVMGQVANSDPTATIIAGTTDKPCYNLVAPPSTARQKLNGDSTNGGTWNNVGAGDRIYLSLANGFTPVLQYDATTKKWQWWQATVSNGIATSQLVDYAGYIEVGTGFWYVSTGGSSPTVTWTDIPKTSSND